MACENGSILTSLAMSAVGVVTLRTRLYLLGVSAQFTVSSNFHAGACPCERSGLRHFPEVDRARRRTCGTYFFAMTVLNLTEQQAGAIVKPLSVEKDRCLPSDGRYFVKMSWSLSKRCSDLSARSAASLAKRSSFFCSTVLESLAFSCCLDSSD
jgi:hypothetical protein